MLQIPIACLILTLFMKPLMSVKCPLLRGRVQQINSPDIRNCNVCGTKASKIKTLTIYNGEKITKEHYPWIVPIVTFSGGGLRTVCMGSFISSQHVITAAHCLVKSMQDLNNCVQHSSGLQCFLEPNSVHVISVPDSGRIPDDLSEVRRNFTVEVGYIPLNYVFNSSHPPSDIALLLLTEQVNCTKNLVPICLPNKNLDWRDKDIIIAGVGKDALAERDEQQNVLKAGVVHWARTEFCTRKEDQRNFNEIFCTSGNISQQSPCSGDSGSILFAEFSGVFYAAAVHSARETKDCNSVEPISGVKIRYFLSWVKDLVGSLLPAPVNRVKQAVFT